MFKPLVQLSCKIKFPKYLTETQKEDTKDALTQPRFILMTQKCLTAMKCRINYRSEFSSEFSTCDFTCSYNCQIQEDLF